MPDDHLDDEHEHDDDDDLLDSAEDEDDDADLDDDADPALTLVSVISIRSAAGYDLRLGALLEQYPRCSAAALERLLVQRLVRLVKRGDALYLLCDADPIDFAFQSAMAHRRPVDGAP